MRTKEKIETKYREARMDAAKALTRMGVKTSTADLDYAMLIKVLGHTYHSGFLLAKHMTDEDCYKCELLAGPHGYSIFKMLCVKHGLTEFVKNCEDV